MADFFSEWGSPAAMRWMAIGALQHPLVPAGMRYGVRTVSGGVRARCWDAIPGMGRVKQIKLLWRIGLCWWVEYRLSFGEQFAPAQVMTLLCSSYLNEERVLCCLILTACPASWIFWAGRKGDSLPCWFKELLWDERKQASCFWGQPGHKDTAAVWFVAHPTWQPLRRGFTEVRWGPLGQCLGWMGKTSHTWSFSPASQHPVPAPTQSPRLSLGPSRCFYFFLIHI